MYKKVVFHPSEHGVIVLNVASAGDLVAFGDRFTQRRKVCAVRQNGFIQLAVLRF